MTDAISSSLAGLQNATERFYGAAKRVASAPQGGADLAAGLVDEKIAENQFKANAKMLKMSLERDKQILDILV